MEYRAFITLDWGKPPNSSANVNLMRKTRQDLTAALIQIGWLYVETTTFRIDTDDLRTIWHGIELIAKTASSASPSPGILTSLSFNVIGGKDLTKPKKYAYKNNNALQALDSLPFP